MVGDPLVLVPVLRRGRVDLHAADGVGDRTGPSRGAPAAAAANFGFMTVVSLVIAHDVLRSERAKWSGVDPDVVIPMVGRSRPHAG